MLEKWDDRKVREFACPERKKPSNFPICRCMAEYIGRQAKRHFEWQPSLDPLTNFYKKIDIRKETHLGVGLERGAKIEGDQTTDLKFSLHLYCSNHY